MPLSELYWFVFFVGFLGVLFGSFANVLIYRIPLDLSIGLKKGFVRSFCPHCRAPIPFYLNIPILSFVLLKGRAKCCQKKISIRYPFVELFTGLLFSFVTWVYFVHLDAAQVYWVDYLLDLFFIYCFVIVSFIDIDHRIIPDRFSLGCWAIAIFASFFTHRLSWQDSVIGGLFGFGIFFSISFLYEKLRGQEGLGFGDVKMMGWLGAWLGWMALPMMIVVASGAGLAVGLLLAVISKKGLETAIPFGPFLAVGAFVMWLLSMQILI